MPILTFTNSRGKGPRGINKASGGVKIVGRGESADIIVNEGELAGLEAYFDISPVSQSGGGGDDGDGDGFDAEAFIDRTLDEISDDHLLALSPDQLAAVRAAEIDREKPRKGLTDRIDALTS